MAEITGSFGHSSLLSHNYVYYQRLKTDAAQAMEDGNYEAFSRLDNLYQQGKKKGDLYIGQKQDRIQEAINYLTGMALKEQNKELRLLEKEFGIIISPDELKKDEFYPSLIKAYTTFEKAQDGMQRIISKMKFGKDSKKNVGMIADVNFIVTKFSNLVISRFDETFCQQLIDQAFNSGMEFTKELKKIVAKETGELIMQAAIDTFSSDIISEAIWGKTPLAAEAKNYNKKRYKDTALIQELTTLKQQFSINEKSNVFLDKFREKYNINELVDELTKAMTESISIKKGNIQGSMSSITQGLKVNAQIGGELQETISNMAFPKISATFNSGTKTIKAVHTGPKQYKPDNIYFFIDIPTKKFEQITTKLLDKEKINDSSVYYQNIKKMEEMYDSIKHLNKESFLVFENVKTGSSGSDKFKGFSAGTPIRLENFTKIMNESSLSRASTLVGLIMQLAPGAIYGNSTEMREAIRLNLSKALANFLFDDYKMLGNDLLDKGANAVHLFNLNGIRVPLSYFLAQAAEALAETAKATNGIFNISIHVPEILYGGSEYYYDDYTPDMWAAQQAHTLYNSTITVTFLKKFNESMLKFFGNLV